MRDLTFRRLREANPARNQSADGFGHSLVDWTLSDWFLATMGELGEAANIAKKLNRARDGIDIDQAIENKFNQTSDKIGYAPRLEGD